MKINKILYKIQDHMLIGSIYDNIIKKTKYKDKRMSFLYNVMVGQKHRMLYYKKLKKKYLKAATADVSWEKLPKKANADTIWFCWLQGIDNAPELVKVCYEALQKNVPDKEIILIDWNNYNDYIELPDFIIEKVNAGIISKAHLSDLIRLELLIKYGGYWIDSTVLCTDGSILKKIDDTKLFMYSFYYFGFNPEIMELNNWFIYSTTNNNILCLVRKMLYMYWKDYNRTIDYFVFHLIMTIATEWYWDEYRKMPIISQADAHILATYIYDDFDKEKYEILKMCTGIHKLSTRFNMDRCQKDGTFYKEIIMKKNY